MSGVKRFFVLFLLIVASSCFAGQVPAGIFDEGEFVVFVPENLDDSYVYPTIIGFSPGGRGSDIISTWRSAATENNCIILGSNVIRNGMDIQKNLITVKADIKDKLALKYPIDLNKIVALGSSGGGMAAHLFSFFHPDIIAGVITNVGYIHETSLKQSKRYPRGKACAFLASPTDFNYKLMQQDIKFLEQLKWKCTWLEFEGGHRMAPEHLRSEALDFVLTSLQPAE